MTSLRTGGLSKFQRTLMMSIAAAGLTPRPEMCSLVLLTTPFSKSGKITHPVVYNGNSLVCFRDRRSLGSSRKPSGVLIGHTEGITYVSAKGDGRYVISNGKDQAMRLWDLRKMRSSEDFDVDSRINHGIPRFDYRYTLAARYVIGASGS